MNFNDFDFKHEKNTFDMDDFSKRINDYLSSPDYEEDSLYWKNQFETGEYLKFYNIKSNDYKSKQLNINFKDLKYHGQLLEWLAYSINHIHIENSF